MNFPKDKDELVKMLHHGIDEASRKIDELKVQASLAKAEGRQAIEERVEALQKRRDEVKSELRRLQTATGAAVQDVAEGCKHSWQSLRTAVENAIREFK